MFRMFFAFCFIAATDAESKLHDNDNPCINEEVLGLKSSLLSYQGWNFSKSTNTLRLTINVQENTDVPFHWNFKSILRRDHQKISYERRALSR